MAAYAALDSLMQLIDDIQHHPSPPISMDKDQVESLTEIVTFLQGFLQSYNSSVADDDDEKVDPLEMRMIEAAYAAEDIIESYIVDVIKLSKSTTTHDAEVELRWFCYNLNNSSKSSSSGWDEEVDPGEEVRSSECRVDASKEEVHQRYSSSVADDNSEADPLVKSIDNDETSSVADDNDGADSLGMRITNAAESITESNIVEVIKPSVSSALDSGEQSISDFSVDDDSGEESCFHGEVTCINLYENLHQVIEEMDLIKKLAIKVDAEKPVVSFKSSPSSIEQNSSNMMEGSEDVLLGIMEKLFWGQDNSQVISIVGMGGIGKTTLAKTVYSDLRIKEHFDICAWATISQQYNIRQILCTLLPPEEQSEGSEEELGLKLYQYLYGRRFLIVMDDMWDIVAWDKMQRFFPNNGNGSRILVTTRLSQLSSQLNSDYSLQMRFLDESSSWNLFSKTVFGEENCPLELVEIGKEIVENCRGLPLSIVVVGGLLKKLEQSRGSWESIRNNLTSVVISENDKHCLRLLKLSYNHLPIYLKPCFLYMGVFEEDCSICVSRLIKLWIYEGFVKSMNGKSFETTAKGFLKELVDRNLILVDRLGFTGSIKCCKIHDLLRDLCLRESRKYGFYHVIGRGIPQGINSERRCVIIETTSEQKDIDALQSMSHKIRSVICEKEYSIVKVPWCRNFVLLRTLEIECDFTYKTCMDFPVFRCVNLRHLKFVFPVMFSSLSSVNLMWNLHTLIVSGWSGPIEIWDMPQLRHIEFMIPYYLCLPDPPSYRQHVMENLHTLKGVRSFKCSEEVVKRIPNVKKLRLIFFYEDEVIDHCLSNIRCLSKLESLNIDSLYAFRGFVSLHKLTFPKSLKSLTLWMNSEFEWKYVLEEIASLPFLEKLKMVGGCFEKGKWEIFEEQFPSLKYLELRGCKGLKEWTAQENSMFPRLEHLYLIGLRELEKIPSEIGEIPTLQRIRLNDCSEAAVMSAKEIVDEQMELQGGQLSFHVDVDGETRFGRSQL